MKRIYLCLLTVLLFPLCSFSEIGPLPGGVSVKPIFEQSELVCSARVQSVDITQKENAGSNNSPEILVTVRLRAIVLDVYKAAVPAPRVIVYQYPEAAPDHVPQIRPGDVELLFLNEITADEYKITNRFIGLTTFSGMSPSPGDTGLDKLQTALATDVQRGTRSDQINAMRLLEGFDQINADTLSAMSPLALLPDSELAFAALAVMLKTRTPESVAKFRQYLDGYTEEQPPMALISAAAELSLITDTRARLDLESLSDNRFVSVQMDAMNAIRHIGSVKSAPVLIQRLDDAYPWVQYLALRALVDLFDKRDNDYGPASDVFFKNPQEYISRWKDWWNAAGINE